RGDVLPVGGIRDKVIAAVRAGITEVILPRLNEKDVRELRENVREKVTFHYVAGIKELLDIAF
ncbi:MAG: S16 family serine protease, partial [Desulfobia sp.]